MLYQNIVYGDFLQISKQLLFSVPDYIRNLPRFYLLRRLYSLMDRIQSPITSAHRRRLVTKCEVYHWNRNDHILAMAQPYSLNKDCKYKPSLMPYLHVQSLIRRLQMSDIIQATSKLVQFTVDAIITSFISYVFLYVLETPYRKTPNVVLFSKESPAICIWK